SVAARARVDRDDAIEGALLRAGAREPDLHHLDALLGGTESHAAGPPGRAEPTDRTGSHATPKSNRDRAPAEPRSNVDPTRARPDPGRTSAEAQPNPAERCAGSPEPRRAGSGRAT